MRKLSDKELKRLKFAKESIQSISPDAIDIDIQSNIDGQSIISTSGFGYARDIDGTLVKVNHSGKIIIEKDVVIRAFVTIDRAVIGATIIREGSKIDHHCHIAHGAKIGKWNTLANGCIIEGSCEIGDYNTFGAGVIVQRKVKIGSNCIFGSGSVVTKDVADNSVMVGNPARLLRTNE
mgnify:CR=1 FL=1|tara:strand:- start:840 stop:1373 length:534 start_codon:yes stop_codon:yes gene_type:complete